MATQGATIRRLDQTREGRVRPGTLLFFVVALTLSIVFMFPFFWSISSSLKTISEINTYPPSLFPATPQFVNYATVLEMAPFALWVRNSLFVVLASTIGGLLSSSMVAYAFARFNFRGRGTLFVITIGTLMLPAQVTLIPQFILFQQLGWINTFYPLWVPAWFGGGAFSIFLLRQFFMSLPVDLDEAAVVDGANPFQIYTSILLPLSKPALSTLATLWFINGWNDFLGPIIYLSTPDKFTIAIGLDAFKRVPGFNSLLLDHVLMAASVMAIAPCIFVFLLAQRYFVQGIVMSGIKG